VICPDGFRFELNRGCIDQNAEREAARQREEHLREERFRRSELAREEREIAERRWAHGPGVQVWAGGGYQFFYMPNAYRAVTVNMASPNAVTHSTDGAAVWNGGIVTAGATFISGDLSLMGLYTFAPGSAWQTGAADPNRPCPTPDRTMTTLSVDGFCVESSPMHLVMLDLGQQGVGPRHAWRVGVGVGYEIVGGSLASHFSYRSTIRIAAGFFVAIEARLLGMIRFAPETVVDRMALRRSELSGVPAGWSVTSDLINPATMSTNKIELGTPGLGGGGNVSLLLGYSFH
jgi:hypothetical protein